MKLVARAAYIKQDRPALINAVRMLESSLGK
jgi:hypothetical protein